MKLNWQNPSTWMVAGLLIVVIGLVVAELGDNGEATNPVAVVGGVFFLIGAFTWAVRRGLESSKRD